MVGTENMNEDLICGKIIGMMEEGNSPLYSARSLGISAKEFYRLRKENSGLRYACDIYKENLFESRRPKEPKDQSSYLGNWIEFSSYKKRFSQVKFKGALIYITQKRSYTGKYTIIWTSSKIINKRYVIEEGTGEYLYGDIRNGSDPAYSSEYRRALQKKLRLSITMAHIPGNKNGLDRLSKNGLIPHTSYSTRASSK